MEMTMKKILLFTALVLIGSAIPKQGEALNRSLRCFNALCPYIYDVCDATSPDPELCTTQLEGIRDNNCNTDDYDADNSLNNCDMDMDGDLVGDRDEVLLYGTDPTTPDSDGDTFCDGSRDVTNERGTCTANDPCPNNDSITTGMTVDVDFNAATCELIVPDPSGMSLPPPGEDPPPDDDTTDDPADDPADPDDPAPDPAPDPSTDTTPDPAVGDAPGATGDPDPAAPADVGGGGGCSLIPASRTR